MTPSSDAAGPLRILVIPGDGIGHEVIPAAVAVLRATGLPLEFTEADAGWGCFARTGRALPDATLAAARAADAVLFGAVASPSAPVPGYRSPIVALRKELDLYANIRPIYDFRFTIYDLPAGETIENRKSKIVNLVVVRENTEDLYVGNERVTDDGETATAERVITRRASERIARVAFELARARGQGSGAGGQDDKARPLVTIVHKANVLRETCGLFRATALKVAAEYPDVRADELLVDNAALQLVQRPQRFDVLVTTNMFGDILSDVASYWCGGLGMATSANIGDDHALFEPVHGAAPDIAGRGIANPLAAIGCAAMLLEHAAHRSQEPGARSQEPEAVYVNWAARIRAAVRQTLTDGVCTPDLGGTATTAQVTAAVLAAMGRHATEPTDNNG